MSVVNASPLLAAAGGEYQISRSVRLRQSASAYFNRTPASASNRKTWTWSGWVKRGGLPTSGYYSFFGADSGSGQSFYIAFDNSTQQLEMGQGATVNRKTTQVFRDPSSWYHLVIASDTTQATGSSRLKIYVNGNQVTAFATSNDPSLNGDWAVNNNVAHSIGADITNTGARNFLDGYLTEVNFIDGQALTPSSFGETDAVTGVWKPKKYAGTYGTNGFYLNFSDPSAATAAAIGKDSSGNGNNWTPNNISVTAGATYDSMLDSPTVSLTSSNYATLNPLAANSAVTAAQGNLSYTSSNDRIIKSTISVTSGKWYWEFAPGGGGSTSGCGVINPSVNIYAAVNLNIATAGVSYLGNGNKSVNGTASSYGATYTSGNIIGIALDLDSNSVTFYKDNTSQGSISITSGLEWCPAFDQNTGTNYVNFGQRPFAYTPPTGFKALNTQNLPEPTILKGNKYFDATTYTGTGSTRSVTNAGGFQPDFVWVKNRGITSDHLLFDSIRGATKRLFSNLTDAESTSANSLTAFNSDGFSVGVDANINGTGNGLVGWQWKASGSTVSNTAGSITSTVSANPTAGFSVVTFNIGSAGASTVGHGLGVAPKMIIAKDRTNAGGWPVYHASATNQNQYLILNANNAPTSATGIWGASLPTSTVFGVTSNTTFANNDNIVAYCFSEVAGYSRFGSYVGNGSADGAFIHLGFRPRYIMLKNTSRTNTRWIVMDTARDAANVAIRVLSPNGSNAEDASTVYWLADFLANGIKLRYGADSEFNQSGDTYIYMAFAENPFKNALAR